MDRTTGRSQTFYDTGGAVHVAFADPYCPVGRATSIGAARATGWEPTASGTLVVIEGPRFSTRAESQWYAAQGWTLIGMTGHPEAVLARELALCYTTITLVTDTQPEVGIVLSQPQAGRSQEDGDALAAMLAKGEMYPVHFSTEDLDATFEKIAATPGVEILEEPATQPWGVRDAAVRDPAGNRIRVQQA